MYQIIFWRPEIHVSLACTVACKKKERKKQAFENLTAINSISTLPYSSLSNTALSFLDSIISSTFNPILTSYLPSKLNTYENTYRELTVLSIYYLETVDAASGSLLLKNEAFSILSLKPSWAIVGSSLNSRDSLKSIPDI